jgi:hypothetical protein
MLDLLARRPGLDLTVVYAGSSVQRHLGRRGRPPGGARGRMARPDAYRLLRHDYPLSVGGARRARAARPSSVSGWSTFASQAAVAWCRRHGVPYVLLVESNERDARGLADGEEHCRPDRRGRRSRALVVGSLARAMRARGVDDDRIPSSRIRSTSPGSSGSRTLSPGAAPRFGQSRAWARTMSPSSPSRA